ncbi:MFS transporter [Leucobacter sp. NPDC058333]|uniref:MFS transporter n=1 Tax=Leucobacter sp. NPDC058333 TaxID=3346450 RepID=UPI00366276B0
MSSPSRRQGVAAGILTVAVGLSVRYPITSVSPLLGEIRDAYGLSHTAIAVLTSIPVLLFGLASPLAPALVARLGLSRSISILLAALAVATLVRPLAPVPLFAGTVIVGATIALLGILAPQIIRHSLAAKGGFWTGVYTTSFGVSAATGAALSIPLFHAFGDRAGAALAAWSVPLLIATALALVFSRRVDGGVAGGASPGDQPRTSVFRARGLWPVTGFFGCQALIYFSLTAWLPTIAISRGADPAQAGLLLAWMSIAGLPASLIAPSLASRARWRIGLLVGTATLAIAGLLSLAFAPTTLMPVAIAVLGIALSSAFGLSIALIVFTAPSIAQTASFSAVSQGIGYGAAAAGPLVPGLLVESGVGWSAVLVMLAIVALGELAFGVAGARASRTPRA